MEEELRNTEEGFLNKLAEKVLEDKQELADLQTKYIDMFYFMMNQKLHQLYIYKKILIRCLLVTWHAEMLED